MSHHEIPGVTMVVSKDFPTPLAQFQLALEGGWYYTAKILYERHRDPNERVPFLMVLLPHSSWGDITPDKIEQRWRDLEAQYKAKTANGGTNNNNRFRKT